MRLWLGTPRVSLRAGCDVTRQRPWLSATHAVGTELACGQRGPKLGFSSYTAFNGSHVLTGSTGADTSLVHITHGRSAPFGLVLPWVLLAKVLRGVARHEAGVHLVGVPVLRHHRAHRAARRVRHAATEARHRRCHTIRPLRSHRSHTQRHAQRQPAPERCISAHGPRLRACWLGAELSQGSRLVNGWRRGGTGQGT
jgi:hypothetical protein